MFWKGSFRELEIERKQREEEKRRVAEEQKIRQEECRKMVWKFHSRVAKVIKRFSQASGYELREDKYGSGNWYDSSLFSTCASGDYEGPYFKVCIIPSAREVYVFGYGNSESIPLSAFTEEALAEALVRVYKKGRQS